MDILILDLCNLFPCFLLCQSTDPADKDSWEGKTTGQLSITAKRVLARVQKIPSQQLLFKMMYATSWTFIVCGNLIHALTSITFYWLQVGKVLLNALLYPGIKTSAQKNSVVAIFRTLDSGGNNGNAVARTFLIRTKSEEDRNKLATVIQEILLLYVLPWPACSGALGFPKAVMPIFRERLHYITVFPQQMQYKQR
ncbi:hypothetical protein Goari_012285 [Gossypium aridum]|uniref:Uncharacterized protein n=1 Tax=Gossypium aridum TaxID=34290 RepID=A0A7J8WZZ3_GOSAI|nr:hypothetical protein [Gossypium aridum]